MLGLSLLAMTRVAIVNYLNTTPFVYGIRAHQLDNNPNFDFRFYHPADCANALLTNQVDIGLVPVAVLPQIENYHIIGNTCIGAYGKVDSVLLVSNTPIENVNAVWLDYQSRTSVALCRILMRDFWQKEVAFRNADQDYLNAIPENEAAVVIGDRAFDAAQNFRYSYDLAEMWKLHTNLPFVFALWVSKFPVPPSVAETLNSAFLHGVKNCDQAALQVISNYPPHYSIHNYLTRSISYTFDDPKKKGLETFLSLLSKS
jgi:chorismate dehydratase